MRTSAITLIAAVVLSTNADTSHAINVNYDPLVFDQPSYSQSGVTASGSANVISVNNLNGLAIKGGESDFSVNNPETISFTFAGGATNVELSYDVIGGLDTANSDIEAFAPGGGSLGTLTIDLFVVGYPTPVSLLYANVPIESFTLSPLTTNKNNVSTGFRVQAISWQIPEPATLALASLGLMGMGWRRRRQF
jgi:PEP-CTERM motif